MRATRSTRLVTALAAALLLAGCGSSATGSGATPSPQGRHTMADGSTMTDAQMKQMGSSTAGSSAAAQPERTSAPGRVTHRGSGPSTPAGMICSLEIAQAVKRVYALPQVPTATDSWADRVYTCTYRLPTGSLRLSVKDLGAGAAGTAYFTALQRRLPGAARIAGLQNLGFPAFQTPAASGSVAFLKDGKTLWVDAGRVTPADLPPGFSRTATAYAVAAAILACWTD